MEMQQTSLVNRYKMVNREIDQIKGQFTKKALITRDKNRLQYLKENKKKIREQLNNPDYSIIREPLEQEYRKYI
jgi:hypothetical protein